MNSSTTREKLNIADEVNKFFFSPKIYLALLGILFFAILNVAFFAAGYSWAGTTNPWGFGIDGLITGNGPDAWFGYLNIFISTVGGTLSIFALILTVRLDKNFIAPIVIGETLVMGDSIMIGAIFTAVSYAFMISASIYSYITWGNGGEDDKTRVNIWVWLGIGTFLVAYIAIGLSYVQLSGFNGGLIGHETAKQNFIDKWGVWWDVIGSAVVTVAYFLMYRKFKHSFSMFLVTDTIYIIFFFQMGLWSTAASYMVYLITDSCSLLTWWYKDQRLSEGKELKVEN